MTTSPILRTRPLGFPWETRDPFLFCAYHLDAYPAGNEKMGPSASLKGRNPGQDFDPQQAWRMYHGGVVPGFPVHPHRGFETVTIVQQGWVDHSDSLGATARFGGGDVQWMTAGKGIQHSEMFPLLNRDEPNPLELFQIWLNLPKAGKLVEPYFSMLWHEDVPLLKYRDEAGNSTVIKMVAGALENLQSPPPPPDSWAARAENEVAIWIINLDENAHWTIPGTKNEVNRSLYFFQGSSLDIGGQSIRSGKAIDLISTREAVLQNGNEKSCLLMLQGKPINEPVAQYGPFVMNSQEEIRQTIADYQKTQFGGWPWPITDPVHPRELGRFAVHANGETQKK